MWLPASRGIVVGGSGLGDVIALESDCTIGEQLVREMQTTFRQLSGVGQDELSDADIAFMRRFGPPVTAIVEEFNKQEAKLSRQIPFSTVCAAVKELGRKAQLLTREMRTARSVGQTSATPIDSPFTPGPAGAANALASLVKVVGISIAVAVLVPAVLNAGGRR